MNIIIFLFSFITLISSNLIANKATPTIPSQSKGNTFQNNPRFLGTESNRFNNGNSNSIRNPNYVSPNTQINRSAPVQPQPRRNLTNQSPQQTQNRQPTNTPNTPTRQNDYLACNKVETLVIYTAQSTVNCTGSYGNPTLRHSVFYQFPGGSRYGAVAKCVSKDEVDYYKTRCEHCRLSYQNGYSQTYSCIRPR